MRLATLLVAVGLLAIAGVGQSQLPPVTLTRPDPVPTPLPATRIDPPQPPVPPTKPADPTVDQMLDVLEALRVQKAELEKKEREMIEAISKKVETQSARMKKLGIGSEKPASNEFEPKRVPAVVPSEIIK